MKRILVIHGPNLNLLGDRDPEHYGNDTFEAVNNQIVARAERRDFSCDIFQSNFEGAIIDKLHEARNMYDGVILNAGAYTHYSYAIRDAVEAIKIPVIEVHMSNVAARDEFRKTSVIAPVCRGSVIGFGKASYFLAVDALFEVFGGEEGWGLTKK